MAIGDYFGEGKLVDVGVSDILGAFAKKEQLELERDIEKYKVQAAAQQQSLVKPDASSQQEARATGNSAANNSVPGYFERIPKWLLFGSFGLLGIGLFLRGS